jgi:CRP/FNR family transcriptional regulator, cyclic AMP receptor protein
VVAPSRLETVDAFAALSPEQREALAAAFDEVAVPAGERIASQGDFAYEFFAIEEGTARVEQDSEVIAMLGPGDCFGEIGLLATGRRTAAVVAETPIRMLAMFDQSFRRFDRDMPEFAELVRARMRDCFSRPTAF